MNHQHQKIQKLFIFLFSLSIAGQVFAQSFQSSITITCGGPAQFVDPEADLQDITFNIANASAGSQTTTGSGQGAIRIQDFRTGDVGCGETPVEVVVQVFNDNDNFKNGTRGLFNGSNNVFEPGSGERAAALSAININMPTCTGCSNFTHSTSLTPTQSLTSATEAYLNPTEDYTLAAKIFSTDHGFIGTATTAPFNFQMSIPAAVPPGVYTAILTYTLTP